MNGGEPLPRVVAIGGSWGGIAATQAILRELVLPADVAVVVTLHRQATRSPLAEVLAAGTGFTVTEPEDKAPLTPGMVHLAPPDYHLLVERGWLALSTEAPVKHSRPSIDAMFESAAASLGDRAVAVVLTGASDDGTNGARAVRRHGGTVIVQDPADAEQPVMPAAVIDADAADRVVALADIPMVVRTILTETGDEEAP
jgi:two-component system, chemotaxis family, protein-glutamate methylesterase/glutaminase